MHKVIAFTWNRRTEWAALTWRQFKARKLQGDHLGRKLKLLGNGANAIPDPRHCFAGHCVARTGPENIQADTERREALTVLEVFARACEYTRFPRTRASAMEGGGGNVYDMIARQVLLMAVHSPLA